MPKRHDKPHRKPVPPGRRAVSPGELGLEFFRQSNYTEAIRQWDKLGLESDAARAALAEAHFRRGLAARRRPSDALPDLRRATELLPDEARYWYHLGLTLHLADQLEEARSAYARAAELGLSRRGLGFARGLAEIERCPGLSLETLPWLDPEDRAALSPVAALLRGEPQAALAAASGSADAPAALWRGLASLVCGDADAARAALALPQGRRLRAGAEEVRVFYHGLAAAAAGDSQAAWPNGREAARVAAQTNVSILPVCGKASPGFTRGAFTSFKPRASGRKRSGRGRPRWRWPRMTPGCSRPVRRRAGLAGRDGARGGRLGRAPPSAAGRPCAPSWSRTPASARCRPSCAIWPSPMKRWSSGSRPPRHGPRCWAGCPARRKNKSARPRRVPGKHPA